MKKTFTFILVCLMLFSCLSVSAVSVSGMTDENTYIDEAGNVYTYQNDKVYQLIDGTLYELVNGNEQSIIDVMKKKPGSEAPDAEIMGQAQSVIGSTIGVALSVIIYVFFAMTAFTTACDLLYIGVPAIRPTLYDEPVGMPGMSRMPMGMPGMMQSSMGNNQGMTNPQAPKGRCFISRELKSLVRSGQMNSRNASGSYNMCGGSRPMQAGAQNPNIMLAYVKRRAVSIVIIIAVFMLLVTSTVFTDFGLNIGNMIYQKAASLLGF